MRCVKRWLGLGFVLLFLCAPIFLAVAGPKLTIGMCGELKNEYHFRALQAAKNQASILGIETIMLDSKRDPAVEIQNVEQFIASKVSAIVAIPMSSESITVAVKKANNAKIPFVALLDVPQGGDFVYVGSDLVQGAGGEIAAEALAKALNYSGNIVYIRGTPGLTATKNRDQGLQNVLKKNPNLKVVVDLDGDWTRPSGMKIMENALAKFPKVGKDGIAGVYAMNDAMALGALRAITTACRVIPSLSGLAAREHAQLASCALEAVVP